MKKKLCITLFAVFVLALHASPTLSSAEEET